MSVVFGIEPLATVWDELIENAWMHWQETEMHKRGEKFSPSYERYASYGPQYIVFTARDDGQACGELRHVYYEVNAHAKDGCK